MEIAKLNGINIHYKIHGHHDETLMLISGVGCDHQIWGLIIPELVKHYNVVVFDNRGVGHTTDDGQDFSISTMAHDCYQLLNYLGINKAHIIGHSLGGRIAQQFAIAYPLLTNKLVIINSSSYASKALSMALLNQNKIRQQHVLSPENTIRMLLPWLFSSKFLENEVYVNGFITAVLNDKNPQSIMDNARQLNALVKHDLRAEIGQINNDTLVISSQEDLLSPPFINIETANSIKNSKLITIPGGHVSLIEYPDIVAKTILDYL